MRAPRRFERWVAGAGLLLLLMVLTRHHAPWGAWLLTPDQRAADSYAREQYAEAAERFDDPAWKAAACFRAGSFVQASELLLGFETAEGAYNHGTALCMLGKYQEAIPRFEHALAQRPDWPEAEINLQVARDGAERMNFEGGNMTGGQMGADEITFTEGKPPNPDAEDEVVEEGMAVDDASMRAMWLRKVQTKPSDFLQVRFAYQAAKPDRSGADDQGGRP